MGGSFAQVLGMMAGLWVLGCSFIAVSGPPSAPSERTEKAADECTTIVVPPVVDTMGAFWLGAMPMLWAAKHDSANDEHRRNVQWYGLEMTSETALAVGATNLAIFTASATYGFIQTSRCATLRREVQNAKPLEPTWSPALSTVPTARPSVPPPPIAAVAPAPPVAPAPSSAPSASAPAPASSASIPTVSFPDP